MMYVLPLALAALLTCGVTLAADTLTPPDTLPDLPQGRAWKLAFNDEFDGTVLDESKWEAPPEQLRCDGWWTRQAISLDGQGRLVMSTRKEGDRYITGCLRTRGKFEHAFGYYVARVQLQKQPGHSSAFWLYNSCVGKIGEEGRDGTEIDIYEKWSLDDVVPQHLHWDGYGVEHKAVGNYATVPGVMEGFHTFSLWWEPDEYVFYVDGVETWRTNAGGVCQAPLYAKLSDAVDRSAGNIADAQLPDAFLVDYVRVYDVVDGP
jgi:beta-glucanase (GH16 family)